MISPNHQLYSNFNEVKTEHVDNISQIQLNSKFSNPSIMNNNSNQSGNFDHMIVKEEISKKKFFY